jgi:ABC-2 type transport system ATP-binding protein
VSRPGELVGVSKSFGSVRALDRLDLTVDRDEIVAVLGPNGAGKTTAIGVLLGLRRPDSGRALLFGRDPSDVATRRRVGCTPQQTSFPLTLRVGEIVDFVRAHYPRPLARDVLVDRFALREFEHRQAGGLSGGERRRVACALAFAGDPELVVLDEPSSGLDIESRLALWRTIRDEQRTVLLTTHSFEEAEALATRIVVLHRGRATETAERGPQLASAYLALTEAR